ncbi:hypothetical protein BDF19DRAFT_467516 [Syncephalis fuscata]|nr:hypothetical protein BDF19DRAFT_467516 [Syncephalis fuscata]
MKISILATCVFIATFMASTALVDALPNQIRRGVSVKLGGNKTNESSYSRIIESHIRTLNGDISLENANIAQLESNIKNMESNIKMFNAQKAKLDEELSEYRHNH